MTAPSVGVPADTSPTETHDPPDGPLPVRWQLRLPVRYGRGMAENPSLPLYTSVITLPDCGDVAACAGALHGLPGYRRIDGRTVHLGSQLRYALLGTSFAGSSPAPVTVHFRTDPATGDTTATVSPRYFTRIILPLPQVADHQYRTAVMVRDALATVSPAHPTLVTRIQASRREYDRSWLSSFIVFIVTMLVVLGIIGVFTGWPVWTTAVAALAGGLVGSGLRGFSNRPPKDRRPPVITVP